jgi:hypothetical protein
MTAYAGENGHVQQKLETAEAVRHADDSDVFEMREVAVSRKWQGTEIDRKEMSQLGRVQELRVSLKRILGYSMGLLLGMKHSNNMLSRETSSLHLWSASHAR